MLVLDISGKLYKKVTISKKFGIVLSNLTDDWKEEFDENIIVMQFYNFKNSKMSLLNKYTPQGTWETDYCKKFFNFLEYIAPEIDYSSAPRGTIPLGTNALFSLIDIDDEKEEYLIKHISTSLKRKTNAILLLKKYGSLIDEYIENNNDFLQLDFLINAIYSKEDYSLFYILNIFSILESILIKDENEKTEELDKKLLRLFPDDEKIKNFKIIRQIRNKIAHGDFEAMKKKFIKYEKVYMKNFWFDFYEFSKENWIISNICGNLKEILKKVLFVLFENKQFIRKIKFNLEVDNNIS